MTEFLTPTSHPLTITIDYQNCTKTDLPTSQKFNRTYEDLRSASRHGRLKIFCRHLCKGAINRQGTYFSHNWKWCTGFEKTLNSEPTCDPTSTLIPYFMESSCSCLSITVSGGMMIVVEPVLKASTVVLKEGHHKKADMSTRGSPGGKRRAATSIGSDLPYPVGTAPIRCCRLSGSVDAHMISALVWRGYNNQAHMLLEPENLRALAVGQDGELSGKHIFLSQFLSFSRSRPFSDSHEIWNWLGALPIITLGITFCILVNGREEVRGASLIWEQLNSTFSSCFLLVFCFIALAKRAGKLIGIP